MRSRLVKRAPLWALLSGAGLLGLTGPAAQAQYHPTNPWGSGWHQPQPWPCYPPPQVQPYSCVPPAAPLPPTTAPPPTTPPTTPPETTTPPTTPPETTPPGTTPETPPATTPEAEPSISPERTGAGSPGTLALSAPNMLGDLLNGSRSIHFQLLRAAGNVNVISPGGTTIINPGVAENNSPIPADRFYYRYNYFNDALSFTGFSNPTFSTAGVFNASAATKFYNVNQHTFGFEKTFFGDDFSVEMRVPFATGLASSNIFSSGTITGPLPGTDTGLPGGNPLFGVTPTPQNTLGHEATEFGDLSVILKALVYESPCLAISGGLGVGIPTAPDTKLLVVDYSSIAQSSVASGQRARNFNIQNNIVGLSPYLAFLARPTCRFFFQGFWQMDIPVGSNTITYSDVQTLGVFGTGGRPDLEAALASGASRLPPFTVQRDIDEQTLMHFDFGAGFWLVQNPCAAWITGIVPTVELHYTTTLDNAQIVNLPGDASALMFANPLQPATSPLVPEAPPRVGNLRNRVDILDLTLGATVFLGDRTTLATGVAFPLKGVDNRTFDWEFQLQLNFYFGGPRRPPEPTFLR